MTGVFVGVHPVQQVTDTFAKQAFAIDTEEKFNNIKVFEAHRTEASDGIAPLVKFKKGDIVRVAFNLRSNKTKDGRWMTNVIAWDVRPFVPQSTDDFQQPETSSHHATTAAPVPALLGDDLPF